jgi:hypothetical protein
MDDTLPDSPESIRRNPRGAAGRRDGGDTEPPIGAIDPDAAEEWGLDGLEDTAVNRVEELARECEIDGETERAAKLRSAADKFRKTRS